MSYGPIKTFYGSIASGASTCSFSLDKAYSKIYADVGTFSTAAEISVYGAAASTGTFRPVYKTVQTSTMQYQQVLITTAAVANGGVVPLYDCIHPNIQFRASAVVSGGVSIALYCVD